MDKEAQVLSRSVAAQVRPQYQGWLKKVGAAQADARAYDKVVELVARKQKLSADKVRFASREVLQEAMALITR